MVTYAICSAPDLLSSALSDFEEPPFFVSRTARINVTPYLEARIEYQYPDEPMKTIFANGGELSYDVNQLVGQCPTTYTVRVDYQASNTRSSSCGQWRTTQDAFGRRDIQFTGKFLGLEVDQFERLVIVFENLTTGQIAYQFPRSIVSSFIVARDSCRRESVTDVGYALRNSWIWYDLKRIDGQPDDCGACTFTVYRDGQQIINETREDCPEVQQFDCELGEVETYEIDLAPLEILFITTSSEFALQNGTLNEGFDIAEIINFLAGNPDNCILIWKLERSFGFFYSITRIAQICSPIGCPPPEYNHECLNSCRSCPPDTCAVECGDHVCCYNSEGIAIETISIEEFCNE